MPRRRLRRCHRAAVTPVQTDEVLRLGGGEERQGGKWRWSFYWWRKQASGKMDKKIPWRGRRRQPSSLETWKHPESPLSAAQTHRGRRLTCFHSRTVWQHHMYILCLLTAFSLAVSSWACSTWILCRQRSLSICLTLRSPNFWQRHTDRMQGQRNIKSLHKMCKKSTRSKSKSVSAMRCVRVSPRRTGWWGRWCLCGPQREHQRRCCSSPVQRAARMEHKTTLHFQPGPENSKAQIRGVISCALKIQKQPLNPPFANVEFGIKVLIGVLLKVWNRRLSDWQSLFPMYNYWERFRFLLNDAVNQYQKQKIWITEVPCENHQGLSVISAGRELCSVGLQRSQTQLEDGFDAVEEETVDHADGAVEGQHAEEEGEEPREGDGGQGGQVWNMFSQLRQTLPDQLLKHRLVHLSSCGSQTWRSGFVCVCVCVCLTHILVLVCTFGLLFMISTTRWQQMCCYSPLCTQCIFLCCSTRYSVLQEKFNSTIILELRWWWWMISLLFKEW